MSLSAAGPRKISITSRDSTLDAELGYSNAFIQQNRARRPGPGTASRSSLPYTLPLPYSAPPSLNTVSCRARPPPMHVADMRCRLLAADMNPQSLVDERLRNSISNTCTLASRRTADWSQHIGRANRRLQRHRLYRWLADGPLAGSPQSSSAALSRLRSDLCNPQTATEGCHQGIRTYYTA